MSETKTKTKTKTKTIVVATSNAHKVKEIMSIINLDGYTFVPLSSLGTFESPIEDGSTFVENAHIKALAAHKATGFGAIADDSGIVVDALGGAPGIYSSRYSGQEGNDKANNEKLLCELEQCGANSLDKRTGRFTCAIVYIDANGREYSAVASVDGKIDFCAHGEGGFGYDPLFLPDEYGEKLSMAELSEEQKNAISHRGKALRLLRQQLVG